ncbi:hypothetical protein [Pelosinus sp. IPA-1]|nr:hypothetical protein [Pelosinus sp. IPA-1]GMA99242.1 hypothetical protein PIPA1_20420 [Pelosinus sp. IPA-1]
MGKTTSPKCNVTVSYNPHKDLAKLARGYAVMIKVAIRIIRQKKISEVE